MNKNLIGVPLTLMQWQAILDALKSAGKHKEAMWIVADLREHGWTVLY